MMAHIEKIVLNVTQKENDVEIPENTVIVRAYDIYNNVHKWTVIGIEKGREYAKRIIREGLWFKEGDTEVFYPVHAIVKVVIGFYKPGD